MNSSVREKLAAGWARLADRIGARRGPPDGACDGLTTAPPSLVAAEMCEDL